MNRLITFFVCFALFFRLFNPIHAFISGGETLAMLIPVILIFVADTMYLRKSSYYLISVILIIAFLNLIKVDYFSNFIPRCVEMSFAFFGLEHYLITGDRTYAKSVLYTSYATLAFLIIFSIPQFILIPNLSRLLQSREENADIDFSYYWTISYVFIHHLTIFQIPLYAIYQFTEKKLYKILSSVGIFVILLLLIFADATTPLLMSFFTLIFFLLYKGSMSFSSQIWKFIVLGAFFFLFTSSTVIVSSLRFIQPIFQDSSNYKKIDEIILYLTNNETSGDLEQRGDEYWGLSCFKDEKTPSFSVPRTCPAVVLTIAGSVVSPLISASCALSCSASVLSAPAPLSLPPPQPVSSPIISTPARIRASSFLYFILFASLQFAYPPVYKDFYLLASKILSTSSWVK